MQNAGLFNGQNGVQKILFKEYLLCKMQYEVKVDFPFFREKKNRQSFIQTYTFQKCCLSINTYIFWSIVCLLHNLGGGQFVYVLSLPFFLVLHGMLFFHITAKTVNIFQIILNRI